MKRNRDWDDRDKTSYERTRDQIQAEIDQAQGNHLNRKQRRLLKKRKKK